MFTAWGWYDLDWQVAAVLALLGWFAPQLGTRWLTKIEAWFAHLAGHRRLAIAALFVLPILIRLSLLPLLPLQPPHIHDEFSYLLAGDTFAHGRLANPSHPMWIYFDTFHVLQHPTYASMYPPAQGAALALGQLLGHPWIGVLLSMGAMCAAFLWMFQGWVPARWAFLGAVLVLGHFAILSYWMNSYWGGAVAALGGALVMGAVPRLLRKQRPRDAEILSVGAGILAMSRPLEGSFMCVPVAIVLARWMIRQRGDALRQVLLRVAVPATAVLLVVAGFMLYYNWKVTADPLLFPHQLNVQTYHSVPVFLWGELRPPKHYENPQFQVFYNIFERQAVPRNWAQIKGNALVKLSSAYRFFLGLALALPFAALWPVFANARTRMLVLQLLLFLAGALAVIWFQPHYYAPVMATLFIVLVQALRYLRTWRFAGRAVGIGLTRAIVIAALLAPLVAADARPGSTYSPFARGAANPARQRIIEQLRGLPDNQLVIVRYTTPHYIHDEWVYNSADIDRAKIVWAREIPGVSSRPLLDYFKDRRVWLVEPDIYPAALQPYVALSLHP